MIESGFPGEGNMLVFNNGASRPEGKYSSSDELTPPVDSTGDETEDADIDETDADAPAGARPGIATAIPTATP